VAGIAVALVAAKGGVAEAACTPTGSTVECAGVGNTVSDVNTAINPPSITTPDVTLILNATATIIGPGALTPDQAHSGAVTIDTSGTIGTTLDPVDITIDYVTPTSANVFTFNNRLTGIVNGGVTADNVGGSVTFDNAGVITNGVSLYSNVGTSVTTDGVLTYTPLGGNVTATNSGTIGTPAEGIDPYIPANFVVTAGGNASIVNSGLIGLIDISGGDNLVTVTPAPLLSTNGTQTTETYHYTQAQNAGGASAELTASGRVGEIDVTSYGTGGASVVVNGIVGTPSTVGDVFADGDGYSETYSFATTTDSANVDYQRTVESDRQTPNGGPVSILVGEGGQIFGSAFATAGGNDASITVNGAIGSDAIVGSAKAYAQSVDYSFDQDQTTVTPNDASTTHFHTVANGGTASVTVASGGAVVGSAEAYGNAGVDIHIDGQVGTATQASNLIGSAVVTADVDGDGFADGYDYEATYIHSSNHIVGVHDDVSDSSEKTSKDLAGLVSAAIGETGSVSGGVTLMGGAGGTTASVAGRIGSADSNGYFDATAQSIDWTSSESTFHSNDTAGDGTFTTLDTNSASYSGSSSGGAALVDIAATGEVYGNVAVAGDASATLNNSGLLHGDVSVSSTPFSLLSGAPSSFVPTDQSSTAMTIAPDGVSTTVEASHNTLSFTPIAAGPASFTNAAGGVVDGGVSVSGSIGGATLVNNGSIRDGVFLGATATSFVSDSHDDITTVFTPSTNTTQISEVTSASLTQTRLSGVATGTYGGIVGAFASDGDAGNATTVTQIGDAGSVATISGTIVGDFFASSAEGGTATLASSTTETRTVVNGVTSYDYSATGTQDFTNNGASNAVTITGVVADLPDDNDLTAYGNVELNSAGDSTLLVNGGQVQGSVVIAAGGIDSHYTGTSIDKMVDDVMTVSTDQSTYTASNNVAKGSLALTGGTVKGDIGIYAGSDASLTADAGSTIGGGSIVLSSDPRDRVITTSSDDIAGTYSNSDVSTSRVGNASLTNAGTIGAGTLGILDGYADDPVDILLKSSSKSTVDNSGKIYGNFDINAFSGVFSIVTEETNSDGTRTIGYTKSGGEAAFTNTGLIGGVVSLTAGTGTANNKGVIRGGMELGFAVQNYTTQQAIASGSPTGGQTITALNAPFAQSYTFNQNGLLVGAGLIGIGSNVPGEFDAIPDELNAIYVSGAVDPLLDENGDPLAIDPSIAPADGPLLTSTVAATVNLNPGSVTIGNIVAEHDPVAGTRYTQTSVNLTGTGFLGISGTDDFRLKESVGLLSGFGGVDPLLSTPSLVEAAVAAGPFTLGSRILGVDSVNKTGTGTFVINGAAETPDAWTMDVGSFNIKGGEVQLDVARAPVVEEPDDQIQQEAVGDPVFGIHGDVNDDASLVLGRRVPINPAQIADSLNNPGETVVDGIDVHVVGNVNQSVTGSLVFGTTPALVALVLPSSGVSLTPGEFGNVGTGFGVSGYSPTGSGNVPFSSPSFLTVDGNLTLGGAVDIVTTKNAIYLDGVKTDLMSVSGTVDRANVTTLVNGIDSPFVKFIIDTRVDEGGRTIVSAEVDRKSYTTDALDWNSIAVGEALDVLQPKIVQQLIDDANGTTPYASAGAYATAQDFALVLATLDTQLTPEQVAEAFQELSSGEFYGSIMTTKTTDAFGDFTRNTPRATGAGAFNLWINPTGNFNRYGRETPYGASGIRVNNYGGSVGVGMTTPDGGNFGIGFGYGDIDINARHSPERANADSYMIGAFGQKVFAGINVGVQAVYAWNNWDVRRPMPIFGRTAGAKFDSAEFRLLAEVSHEFEFGGFSVSPFLRGDLRYYDFDGFTETGGGSIGLIVDGKSKTVFSPEVGAKLHGTIQSGKVTLHPEATASYTLQGEVRANREVAFVVDPTTKFDLHGVRPGGFFNLGAGLSADIGPKSSAFVRASYITGGDQEGAQVSFGVKIGF
jgi:hypothetical protein